MKHTLSDLGWDDYFARQFRPYAKKGYVPGLVVQDNKISYVIYTEEGGHQDAILSGKVWHEAATNADLPAVGDWVGVEVQESQDEAVIRVRLERRTCFSRKVPGKGTEQQVIGANVKTVMLVTEPKVDFNVRRMERYLTLVRRSGAKPVIVVNKSETLSPEEQATLVESLNNVTEREAEIRFVSALEGNGLDELRNYFGPGQSVALVGSSGVGKSTLINALTDLEEWTGDINTTTGKGRHTTTWRTVVFLKEGGSIIDNPGMRELQMWTDEQSLRESFRDVEQLAAQCRFHDCKHQGDAGCHVRQAMDLGELSTERFESYLNLEDEIALLQKRQQKREMRLARKTKRERSRVHRNYEDRIEYEGERELGKFRD